MAFQVGCGDEGLVEQLGCIAQHGERGMLFHEEDGVVLFADSLDGLEDDVNQHSRQTRARAGRAPAGWFSRSASALRPLEGFRLARHVSRACGTTDGPAIGPQRDGFECVNNLGYGDRRHNLNRRGGPQERLHSLQVRQDALPLVSILAEVIG
jgi:hypothetical protein